jgi:hypothetical protein
MVTVDVSGTAAPPSGALTLAVVDAAKKIVSRERVVVQSDGSFAASIPIYNLPSGNYRFVFMTDATPPAAVAGGSFAVGRSTGSPQPHTAQTIQPYTADTIQPYTADTVKPYTAPALKPHAADAGQSREPVRARSGDPGFFFRTFGLAIPGVAYTTDNYATNTRTVTVAPGAVTKSAVRVNPDGTYVWNSSWDSKIIRGRWRADGGAVVLLKGQSGLDWKMQRMDRPSGKAVITLWDQQSIWYNGTPLE